MLWLLPGVYFGVTDSLVGVCLYVNWPPSFVTNRYTGMIETDRKCPRRSFTCFAFQRTASSAANSPVPAARPRCGRCWEIAEKTTRTTQKKPRKVNRNKKEFITGCCPLAKYHAAALSVPGGPTTTFHEIRPIWLSLNNASRIYRRRLGEPAILHSTRNERIGERGKGRERERERDKTKRDRERKKERNQLNERENRNWLSFFFFFAASRQKVNFLLQSSSAKKLSSLSLSLSLSFSRSPYCCVTCLSVCECVFLCAPIIRNSIGVPWDCVPNGFDLEPRPEQPHDTRRPWGSRFTQVRISASFFRLISFYL